MDVSHIKRLARTDPTAGKAEQLGGELCDARIALGLSVDHLAAELRIRRVYLLAIEEGRLRDLPAPAYVLGFVRSYARALGLDADDMVQRYRENAAAAPHRLADLVFPEPVPERGIPAGAVMLAGVVLMVGAYAAWFQWSGSNLRTVDTVPAMPARLEQAARNVAPHLAYAGTLQPLGQRMAEEAEQAAPPPAVAAPSPAGPSAPRQDDPRIVLRAKADSWVSLRDRASNQTMVNRVLKAGETLPVPVREGLLLTAGFAAGLEFVVDGQVTPAFPTSAGVKRDIPMDPDRLKAGNYNPAVAPMPGAVVRAEAPATPAAMTAPGSAAAAPAIRAAKPYRGPARPEDAAYEPPR